MKTSCGGHKAMVVSALEMILVSIIKASMEVDSHRSLKLAQLIVGVFHSIL